MFKRSDYNENKPGNFDHPENQFHRKIARMVTPSNLTTRNSINHDQAGKLAHHQIRASDLEIEETVQIYLQRAAHDDFW